MNTLDISYVSNEELQKICLGLKNDTLSNLKELRIRDSKEKNLTDISCLEDIDIGTKLAIQKLYLEKNDIRSIEALYEFRNVINLYLQENYNLNSLKGVKNMNNLQNLFAYSCNIGSNEIFDTSKDNNGKNIEEDGLCELTNKSNLKIVELMNNKNLKWVGYLSSDTNITTLKLQGCDSIVDIIDIKTIIKNCGNNYTIPTSLSLALLDENTTLLNLKGQTLTSANFMSIKNNKKITHLNLSSLKLTNSSNVELSVSEANSIIQEVLSSMGNIKYLSLNNCKIITSLEFVKNNTNLVELDLRGTSITTSKKGTEEDSMLLLNTYGTKLKTLAINTEGINLSLIAPTLNHLGNDKYWLKKSSDTGGADEFGLICNNYNVLKTIEGCTGLTNLIMFMHNSSFLNGTIDLSGCTSLTNIQICNVVKGWTIPSSCKYLSAQYFYYMDLSKTQNLETVSFINTYQEYISNSDYQKMLSYIVKNNPKISSIRLSSINLQDLSGLKDYTGNNLKTITICGSNTGSQVMKNFKNLNGIEAINTLTTLSIYNTFCENIDSVSSLNNVIKMDLYNNHISGIKALENLNNLTSLNLENNSLYDRVTYTDNEGNSITYKNLDILKKLYNKKLRKIYLGSNPGITDFSIISNLKWEDKSGF